MQLLVDDDDLGTSLRSLRWRNKVVEIAANPHDPFTRNHFNSTLVTGKTISLYMFKHGDLSYIMFLDLPGM